MLITILLLYIGPIIVLFLLGIVSIYLTLSEQINGREYLGWAFLGLSLAVFLASAIGRANVDPSGGTFLGLFHIIVLGCIACMQIPLAVELLSRALMPDPSKGLKVTSDHSKAESDSIKGDFKSAVEEYERVIAKDPRDAVAHFELAELYLEKKDYHKAAGMYEEGLAHARKLGREQYSSAHTRVADIYAHHLYDVEAARRHLQAIIKKYPKTVYADYAAESLDKLDS